MPADRTRFDLGLGLSLSGGTLLDLWWRYTSFGGVADAELLADLVAGRVDCGPHEHDLVAQALNEMFLDNGVGTFPVGYATDVDRPALPTPDGARTGGARASAFVRHDARRASRRSRAAKREAIFLADVATRLIESSRTLSEARPGRRADFARRRAVLADLAARC